MLKMKKFSVCLMLVCSLFMTGCDASKILETITKIAQGIQQAIPAIKGVIDAVKGTDTAAATNPDTTTATATATTEIPNTNASATAVVNTATDKEDIDQNETTTTTTTPTTTTVASNTTTVTAPTEVTATATTEMPINVSGLGQQQMKDIVDYAMKNNRGSSNGQCFNAVWGYLTASGYGKLTDWADLPTMKSADAKDFAAFMNARKENLDDAGLQRLDTALTPPITNPHDPRIPKGAVIVVAAGSTGTGHPTSGDIVIKGDGRFINDGPNMDYGTKDTWKGTILGVYVPK